MLRSYLCYKDYYCEKVGVGIDPITGKINSYKLLDNQDFCKRKNKNFDCTDFEQKETIFKKLISFLKNILGRK